MLKESEIIASWIPENGKKVSIVCAAYNFQSYISDAMNGFLMQKTNFAFEILVGDDCSTDDTLSILRAYEKKYPKIIKIISRKKNIGGDHNWADLLKRSKAEYIANCDGDDYWISSEKLHKQIDFLDKNKDVGLIFTDVNFINEENKIIDAAVFESKKLEVFDTFDSVLINKPYLAPSTWVYRRYLHDGVIDADYSYVDQTFPLLLEVLRFSKIQYFPEITSNYRVRKESQTNTKNFSKRLSFLQGVFKIQMKYLNFSREQNYVEKIIKTKYFRMALPYAVINKDSELEKEALEFFEKNKIKDQKIKLLKIICSLSGKEIIINFLIRTKEFKIMRNINRLFSTFIIIKLNK